MPERIQLRRTRGWRKPEGAVVVGRPTIFGNPFRPSFEHGRWLVRDDNDVDYEPWVNSRAGAIDKCVELFANDLTYWLGGRMSHDPELALAIAGLRGKDLACWCPLGQPCHADVLLEIANEEAS
jgi:hypothetical protein